MKYATLTKSFFTAGVALASLSPSFSCATIKFLKRHTKVTTDEIKLQLNEHDYCRKIGNDFRRPIDPTTPHRLEYHSEIGCVWHFNP